MERKNYFEMLGLDFDPVEANEKKFQELFDKALGEWQKKAEFNLNSGFGAAKTAAAEELALKDDIIAVMSEKKTRMAEAKRIVEQRVGMLEQIADIMEENQKEKVITPSQAREISKDTGLSLSRVVSVFQSRGYSLPKKQVSDRLLNRIVLDTIESQIHTLQKQTDSRFPWASRVQNLYDLACYCSGGTDEDVLAYRRKSTDFLLGVMSSGAVQHGPDMSPAGNIICDLMHTGASSVFCSEENRKKYDLSLQLETISDLFQLIQSASFCIKKDPAFFTGCVKRIAAVIGDDALALELYNSAACLTQEPVSLPED